MDGAARGAKGWSEGKPSHREKRQAANGIAKAIDGFVEGQVVFAEGQDIFPWGRRAIAKGQGFEMAPFRCKMAPSY